MTDKNANAGARPLGASTNMSSESLEPVELLADDFMRRKRSGEKPTINEYCEKHPELADEIREVFPALVVIEQVAPATGDLDASNPSLSSPDAKPIETIGDYRVLREIGRGGMGVVYEAEQESLGRRVALKILPRHIAGDEKALLRFQREARAAARMHHTNIVPVFEVGHDNDYSFYAMQLIKGQGLDHVIADLRDLRSQHIEAEEDGGRAGCGSGADRSIAHSLMTGTFEPEDFQPSDSPGDGSKSLPADDAALVETLVQASGSTVSASLPGEGDLSTAENNRRAYFHSVSEIGLQAAHGLAYAHARGITHRDIKPSNLILDTAGVVWIADFGLARTGDSSMTQTGDILGTIRYMSPERFKGQCDSRADVYSLGLTLYELLVLKPAFESPNRLKLVDIVTKSEVAAPRSIDSRIPRDLETIVLKACDKDPRRRYQSADELADDLQRYINDEPILARRASPTERVARWTRRNPWLATAVSISAVALLAIAGISVGAAQTQAQLNEQLSDANDEQRQLNSELKEKAEEQRKTNQALAESNRSKEELIRDLKRSQSRLAEKQAEFVAEKGDIAEAMMWLGRSLELTGEAHGAEQNRLRSQIARYGAQMPHLMSETAVNSRAGELPLIQYVFRLRNPKTKEEPEIVEGARQSKAIRSVFGGQSPTPQQANLLAFKTTLTDSKGITRDAIRCYDTRTGNWVGKEFAFEGPQITHGINEPKRWLATISYTAISLPKNDDGKSESRQLDVTVTEQLQVRHIDTGDVIFENRSEFSSEDDQAFMSSMMASMNSGVLFSEDGSTLIRFAPTSYAKNVYRVERIEIQSEKVVSAIVVGAERNKGGFRTGRPVLSADGTKLFVPSAASGRFLTDKTRRSLFCINVQNDKQIGSTIRFDDGQPLVLTRDGSRVAVLRREGERRWIQIHNVLDGETIGTGIELNVPMSTAVEMKHYSPKNNRLVVSFVEESEKSANAPRAWVRVFDLTTNTPATPHLPTDGPAIDAVVTTQGQVVVRDQSRVRRWNLSRTNVSRVVVPTGGMAQVQLSALQGQLLTAGGLGGVQLATWDAKTGRLMSQSTLKQSSGAASAIAPSGDYLVTSSGPRSRTSQGRPNSQPISRGFDIQVWEIATRSRVGKAIRLSRQEVPAAINSGGRKLAIVVQPKRGQSQAGTSIRIRDLKTRVSREVPVPRKAFSPDYVTFSKDGQRLLVVSGPIATLDIFDLGEMEITHVRSHELEGFRHVARRFASMQFTNGRWAVSQDERLIAGFDKDGNLIIKDIASNGIVHLVPNAADESGPVLAHPRIAFSEEADRIYFGLTGGLILQSRLQEKWEATASEIVDQLPTITGLKFGDDESVRVTQIGLVGDDDKAVGRDASATLDDREKLAIEHFHVRDWKAADRECKAWMLRRPDDYLPLALRIEPLLQLEQFDEANEVVNSLLRIVGKPTTNFWLDYLANSRSTPRNSRIVASTGSPTSEARQRTTWFEQQRLRLLTNDSERASLLFEVAKAAEKRLDFTYAAESINEACQLEPDSADMHYYRAHLMERMNRWKAALQSRIEVLRLEPERTLSHFRVVVGHLFVGNDDEFHESWAKQLAYGEKTLAGQTNSQLPLRIGMNGVRDTIAKPRLIAGGPFDGSMKRALQMADENLNSKGREATKGGKYWNLLCSGIAEYRRGKPENLQTAIEHLNSAFEGFVQLGGTYSRGEAITRFFTSMVHHKLNDADAANAAYFDGVDRQSRDARELRISDSATWHEWQLAEIARREAETLLKIDVAAVDPIPDSSGWQVLIEHHFDDGIPSEWKQTMGDWKTIDGAACGTLTKGVYPLEAYARLESEIPDLPPTFEVAYETWTSAPMLASCFLRLPKNAAAPVGHRVALSSHPDRDLTNQGNIGTGISLLTYPGLHGNGYWFPSHDPKFQFAPNQHYKVRIIRQPQRMTVFIDGKQKLSSRVRNLPTRSIRFFARGGEGARIFIDNIKISVPTPPSAVDER